MADDEKWGLSREEIDKRVRDLNQKKKAQGPTRGGRSSGQGVKLLYIRDFLYAHATKEHPQNANRIQDFLLTKNIEASTKTIYNDILRLHDDFGVPVVYDAKRWGYYITEPEFKPYELRLIGSHGNLIQIRVIPQGNVEVRHGLLIHGGNGRIGRDSLVNLLD